MLLKWSCHSTLKSWKWTKGFILPISRVHNCIFCMIIHIHVIVYYIIKKTNIVHITLQVNLIHSKLVFFFFFKCSKKLTLKKKSLSAIHSWTVQANCTVFFLFFKWTVQFSCTVHMNSVSMYTVHVNCTVHWTVQLT